MNGKLPAVAKAMILASLPLCALLAACGGGSDDVFDGVSDKNLTASGIEIVDEQPDASAVTYTSDEALEQVNNLTDGAEVLDSRLLRVVLDQPPPEREHIVWAVRVDPDTLLPYSGGSIEPRFVLASTDIDIVILFIDAQTGQNVASFQGKFGESRVAAHPDSTQVPGQRSRVIMYGVSPDKLDDKGIELFGPPDGTQPPAIGWLQAIDIALSLRTAKQVAQIELAQFETHGISPDIDKLVWAVAYMPEGMTPEIYGVGTVSQEFLQQNPDWKPGAPYTIYALSFIDAQTGEEVYYVSAAAIPFATPEPATP